MRNALIVLAVAAALFLVGGQAYAGGPGHGGHYHGYRGGYCDAYRGPVVVARPYVGAYVAPYYYPRAYGYYAPAPAYYYPAPASGFYYSTRGFSIGVGF